MGAARQNSRLSIYIPSGEDGEKNGENFSEICAKKELNGKGWTEKRGLAELLANEKAMGPLLGFFKSTEVGGREGARERELEWEQRDDRVGE